ncbi:MAG: hypothetical protein LBR23_09285 [Spirochaetaceae bacterium]|jgi:hypothetical protein|nr:hypothetical protein [Spirochaetaceae bacterium]
MKSVNKIAIFTLGLCALALLWGCASKSESRRPSAEDAALSVEVKKEDRPTLVDDKGALYGIQTPTWVAEYIQNGNSGVESIKLYAALNCFVVEQTDANREFAVNWVSLNANGTTAIAQMIADTVVAEAQSKLSGEKGGDITASLTSVQDSMAHASFSGARKEADWWQELQYPDGRKECRAMALWVVDRKTLGDQIARNMQNIVDENTAMSVELRAIFSDMIKDVRENGLIRRSN